MNMHDTICPNCEFILLDNTIFRLPSADPQVILVVNTASQCGFAKQFSSLQQLYDRYHARGFTVLGVSSQSFRKQEFEEACDIRNGIQRKGGEINFPITQLTAVRGATIHPFYAWAATQVSTLGRPKWNFHKYLLGKTGKLVTWFSSITDPLSPKVIEAIEAEL
ncbi:glutathione peroxidase [Cardinium endosymbiont of Culicoides punctatus]|uniref:glutathione peroxidase n=1 Tax=Cardinium endosymbiont of Culicoides punctatus TaxID=2304601 RepID=UPI001058E29B|nr:glutathione peroxidase [Cardinium endosymbiont of Culicoides punctatus]TDG95113.1 Hydroperoxy fatty acid reductase gpx1 [Cardinium endosymbiont of Culicoides punctatus]